MSTDELLRSLLPRYYWVRDQQDGAGVLDALVGAIADAYDELRLEIERLYDDVFIATCDPPRIPLIGDGIGVWGLSPQGGRGVNDRAWVGRALSLRRRKGLVATAARGAAAATGWATYIQEGRAAVATTAPLRLRSATATGGFVRLSGRPDATWLRVPWSDVPRGVAISGRPVVAGEPAPPMPQRPAGAPTPAGVALWVWRIKTYPVSRRTAKAADDAPEHAAGRAFRFDPLGHDTRLFARPVPVEDRLEPPRPAELPLPLTPDLLASAVHVARCASLRAGDLERWQTEPDGAGATVDVLRGRLLLARAPTGPLEVGYVYGSPGEIGAGPYGSRADAAAAPPLGVLEHLSRSRPGAHETLADALAAAGGGSATIAIEDSATYPGDVALEVAHRAELRIASAPLAAPVLGGDLRVRLGRGARLELAGVTLAGTLTVEGDGELVLEQCTLGAVVAHGRLALTVAYSVLAGLSGGEHVSAALADTIADGPLSAAGTLDVRRLTVLGDTAAATLIAADCLFTGPVQARRGIVRTSYLPRGSEVPYRIACRGPEDGSPRFVSLRRGDPGFCQLHLGGPREIACGAERGGELGAYNFLDQPERFARLPIVLQELLPAGIEARVEYVT
jgi:hypothetical protein